MYDCRSYSTSRPPETDRTGPSVQQLFGYAGEQIAVAAGELWPGESLQLAEHVPSVTGYVRRVELEREAAQLGLLCRLGRPRVHRVAGLRRGVLFTEVVTGATLAQRFTRSGTIRERSIEGTFSRKFTSIGANLYLDQLAAKWRNDQNEHDDLIALLRRVVIRLGRPSAMLSAAVDSVLVYGDLKPEHVVFEHHAVASDRPVFIDPGLLHARATADAAKLVSRIILLLVGFRPLSSKAIGDGLAAFVDDQTQALPAMARREWLRELVLLWLMDTVNILTTYLSAPAELPLPAHAKAALSQVRAVGALVDKVSIEMAAGDPQSVWRLGLGDAVAHALLATTV